MIRPLNKNIIVKQEDFKHEAKSGLIYTTTTTESPSCGIIIERAKDCIHDLPMGTKVYYSKYAGSKLVFNNEEFLVLNEEDLLGHE